MQAWNAKVSVLSVTGAVIVRRLASARTRVRAINAAEIVIAQGAGAVADAMFRVNPVSSVKDVKKFVQMSISVSRRLRYFNVIVGKLMISYGGPNIWNSDLYPYLFKGVLNLAYEFHSVFFILVIFLVFFTEL